MTTKVLYIIGSIFATIILVSVGSSDSPEQPPAQVEAKPEIVTPAPVVIPVKTTEVTPPITSIPPKTVEKSVVVAPTPTPQEIYYVVTKVIDGDTLSIDMNGTKETLRLIGINTPETVDPRKPIECFGKEASAKANELLSGKRIRIEKDPTQGDRDKYGRLLVYVYREDGLFFNKRMIEDGYAYEYTYNLPYKYQAEFKEAQRMAESGKKGLWAPGVCETAQATPPPSSSPVVSGPQSTPPPTTPTPAPSPTPSGNYTCAYNAYNCSNFSTHAEAQAVFEACGGPASDIHGLDGNDNDGLACESLP